MTHLPCIKYVVHLESKAVLDEADRDLKRLLKYALRACRLRCTHVALKAEPEPTVKT